MYGTAKIREPWTAPGKMTGPDFCSVNYDTKIVSFYIQARGVLTGSASPSLG